MSNIFTKALFFIAFLPLGILIPLKTNTFLVQPNETIINQVVLVNQDSIQSIPDIFVPEKESTKKMSVILTAYSSSPDETWGDPFITASGQRVRDGIIANNCLPFGTIVNINGMYFEVLDRKNSRYGCEWFDIWKPSKQAAINFGIQRTYLDILLEN